MKWTLNDINVIKESQIRHKECLHWWTEWTVMEKRTWEERTGGFLFQTMSVQISHAIQKGEHKCFLNRIVGGLMGCCVVIQVIMSETGHRWVSAALCVVFRGCALPRHISGSIMMEIINVLPVGPGWWRGCSGRSKWAWHHQWVMGDFPHYWVCSLKRSQLFVCLMSNENIAWRVRSVVGALTWVLSSICCHRVFHLCWRRLQPKKKSAPQ